MINNKLMLEHIDYLIRIKSTGRPCNFAKKDRRFREAVV